MVMLAMTMAYCYVGSLAGAPEPEALRVLECDADSGAMKVVQTVTGVEGTSYFQLDRDWRFLYSMAGGERRREVRGRAVRFPLSRGRIGRMEVLAELPCPAPCHVALSPDERRLAFAAYRAATVGTLPVGGGAVAAYVFPDDAMGPNVKRQEKAFAHQAFYVSPSLLGAVDLGCDRIRFFEPETMTRSAVPDLRFDPGDGPRHTVWSRDGKFLFVLCELGSSVYSFAYDGRAFVRVGKWSMLPAGFDRLAPDGQTLVTKAGAVKLTAGGSMLVASNRGHDSIAFYAVDGKTGALTRRGIAKLSGRSPRDFALMPGEKFMVVGHELDNEIQAYRVDWGTCTLTPVGQPIPAWRPVCVAFGSNDGGQHRLSRRSR